MSKSSIARIPAKFNPISQKTGISALFSPIPKSFADLHREWHSLIAQESAATSEALREYFARRRTAILESFPAWERPSVLDKLNTPLPGLEVTYANAQ